MFELVKTIFMAIGIFTVGLMIYVVTCGIINKFDRWRKNGCKIKCLCKPHTYEFYWFFHNSGELALKCKKCGKIKKIIVDKESFDSSMWK